MVEPTNPELKLLTSLSQAFEAEHLKHLLEAEGISAVLDGVHASNNFGFNALMGAIKVRVPADQLLQAQTILKELSQQSHAPWQCVQCREGNDGSFDYCWKCGHERSEPQYQEPRHPQDPENVSRDFTTNQVVDAEYIPDPYATPLSTLRSPETIDSPHSQEELERAEDQISRGYRASILGLILFPPVMHTYSLLLLLAECDRLAYVSPRGQRQWKLGMAISLVALLVAGGFWCLIWWRSR